MGYFFKVFIFFALVTLLNCSPTLRNDVNEPKAQTEEVSVPCVNKKKLLGESEPGIECVPLTGHDREQVLKIDTAFKSFEDVETESFLKEAEDDVEKLDFKVENPANIGELKMGDNPAIENLEEGSGDFVDNIQKTDELVEKNYTTKNYQTKILDPEEGTASTIIPNIRNEMSKNDESSSLNIPIILNETNLSRSFSPTIHKPEVAETKEVSTAHFNFSSAVAGWAAGFFGTFTLIAIGAMCVKNREKKEKKNKKYAVEVVQDEEEALEMT